jgi:hypothetical protein
MTNQKMQISDNADRNAVVSKLLPCLLIGHFLWNVLITAHEYPRQTERIMTMTFEFLMLVGLFGLKRSMPAPLFWIALVAGIGLFALRLTGDAAWATGHLFYSLPPRS